MIVFWVPVLGRFLYGCVSGRFRRMSGSSSVPRLVFVPVAAGRNRNENEVGSNLVPLDLYHFCSDFDSSVKDPSQRRQARAQTSKPVICRPEGCWDLTILNKLDHRPTMNETKTKKATTTTRLRTRNTHTHTPTHTTKQHRMANSKT